MKKFKTNSIWHNLIFSVEVDRETDTSVWINGRRRSKRTDTESYFDTWEEAHAHLLEEAESNAASLRRQLEQLQRGAWQR